MKANQTLVNYTISLLVLSLIFSLTFVLEGNIREQLFDEDGVIEIASALGYFLCAIQILCRGKLDYIRKYYYFWVLIILFGLRELDFHKRFTTMGILKIKFFLSPDVSFTEKLIGFLIVLLLVHIFMSIYKMHFRQFIAGLKNFSAIHIGVLLVALLLGVSKSLDGISRKLGSIGMDLGFQISIHLTVLEEVLELGIPLILILIYQAYFDKQKV